METMFDSVNIAHIPSTAKMVAGYVNGIWSTYDSLVEHFPNATHVSITINAEGEADVLDVEKGDATPEQSLGWVRQMRSKGRTPIVYCSRSNMPVVQDVFNRNSEAEPFYWIADYTNQPHLVPGSVATQWADGTASYPGLAANCDTSLVSPNFPILKHPASPAKVLHVPTPTEITHKVTTKTKEIVPMKLTTESLSSIIRQLAAYAGIATQFANQGHLPTAVRTAIITVSGLVIAVEHYAAKP